MTRLLPSVLTPIDLPVSELSAASLDGELFAIDECFALVDQVESTHLRGLSLAAILPTRLIAEQRTAAWVLGALHAPPFRHQMCVDSAARYRCLGAPRLIVREVVLGDDDTVVCGGFRVTTPLRTALDIARFTREFGKADEMVIANLAFLGEFDLADLLDDLNRRRHLSGKLRAARRLSGAFATP